MPTIRTKEFVMQTDKQISESLKQKNRDRVYKSNIWQSLRKKKLMDNPLCEIHEMAGKTKLAEAVHHIVSFTSMTGNNMLRTAYDYNNLMSLCPSCHALIHSGLTIDDIVRRLSVEGTTDDKN